MSFAPNCITSTTTLNANTNLDVVETEFVNKMGEGLRICKFLDSIKSDKKN